MLTIQNKNIYNSKIFEKFINKLFLKGKKSKYLKIINLTLNSLKKSKLKPNFFFFFNYRKIKTCIFFFNNKKKKKKKNKSYLQAFFIVHKTAVFNIHKMIFFTFKKKKW